MVDSVLLSLRHFDLTPLGKNSDTEHVRYSFNNSKDIQKLKSVDASPRRLTIKPDNLFRN